MAELDFYRRQATLAQVRAEVAETLAQSLRRERDAAVADRAGLMRENARLKALVEKLAGQLGEVREKLKEAVARRRGVPVEELLQALLDALEAGSRGLTGRVIAEAHLDLKAALQVEEKTAGLQVAAAGLFPPQSLSTLSLTVRPTPPGLWEEGRRRGLAAIMEAAQALQEALSGSFPLDAAKGAATALAQISAFLAAPPQAPEEVAGALKPVVDSLSSLAGRLPTLTPAARELAGRVADLPAAPAEEHLAALATALAAVARELEGG
ncbi:MAG: hypothetical protein WHT07_01830 [Desulfobaccales bacterium]